MKGIFPALSAALLTLAACRSTLTTAGTADTVSAEQAAIAARRWPGVTTAQLSSGSAIYRKSCTTCHSAFPIEQFSEKKWKHEIDDMSPRAKLSEQQKQELSYYILSYLELKRGTAP